jgi:hypothetical protein
MATSCAGSSTTSPAVSFWVRRCVATLAQHIASRGTALRSASIDSAVFAVLSVCSACFDGCCSLS